MARTRSRLKTSKLGPPFYLGLPQQELDRALARAAGLIDEHPLVRMEACRYDPLLFAIVYLSHHLAGDQTGGLITLSEFHMKIIRWAVPALCRPGVQVRENRDAFVAPRESGKSTWLFLIVALWSAAYLHNRFTVAFSDTAEQARGHLKTLRHELDTNERLRQDFPELCTARVKPGTNTSTEQTLDSIEQANGWSMTVRGADTGSLGLKKGEQRPDLILADDIEPGEDKYSEYQADGRRVTLLDVFLPMNLAATVVVTGTVTMHGSIIHQLVQVELEQVTEDEMDRVRWVRDENFRVHYQPPIITADDGSERSWWPEKWTLAQLRGMRHTRSYRKNFENQPLAGEGHWWTADDFRYRSLPSYGATVLYIDPAAKAKRTSDWTGLAVVSRAPKQPDGRRPLFTRYATHVKLVGQRLVSRVQRVLTEYPDIRAIVVETNNGGEWIVEALSGLGVPVFEDTATESKEVRNERALDIYQRGLWFHTERHAILEAEQESFGNPKLNDDVTDANTGGGLWLLQKRRVGGGSSRATT